MDEVQVVISEIVTTEERPAGVGSAGQWSCRSSSSLCQEWIQIDIVDGELANI